MCGYTVSYPTPTGDCAEACNGCQWNVTVNAVQHVDKCVYTYTVERTGCSNESDETFNGTITVACDRTKTRPFYCDSEGECVGCRITFTAHACGGTPPESGGKLT